MNTQRDRREAEARFRSVFAHFGTVSAYARRRGSRDPEAIAAEAMAIAWRKLADLPLDDARPWLLATARNLLLAEWRNRPHAGHAEATPQHAPEAESVSIDPDIAAALRTLSVADRETLLLVAWDDLSPKLAARALGIREGAFRVRLHRARRRFSQALVDPALPPSRTPAVTALEMEKR